MSKPDDAQATVTDRLLSDEKSRRLADVICATPPPNGRSAAQIAELHAKIFAKSWPEPVINDLLAQTGALAFIAQSLGKPSTALPAVGFIIGRLAADEVEILTFGVARQFRNQGIGWQLLATLCEAARQNNASKILIEVAAENHTAIRLYHKRGFAAVGRRPGYYTTVGGSAKDAIIMQFAL